MKMWNIYRETCYIYWSLYLLIPFKNNKQALVQTNWSKILYLNQGLSIFIAVTSWWVQRRFKFPAYLLFVQPFVQAKIKENMKIPCHWPLWGESTSERWIPLTKGQWNGKCFRFMTSYTDANLHHLGLMGFNSLCACLVNVRWAD